MVSISSFMYLKISRKGMKRLGGRSDQHPCLAKLPLGRGRGIPGGARPSLRLRVIPLLSVRHWLSPVREGRLCGTASTDRNWPGPGFSWGRRKLTLAGRAHAAKVSFLARPRTHSGGHYEKSSVMTRPWKASTRNTSYAGGPWHSCTSHNHRLFRNSSSESEARKRRLAVSGSCIRASAFSFIARLASVY